MPSTQAHRHVAVQTPLGPDALLVRDFHMTEQLGRLFQIELDLLSDKVTVEFDKLVGHNATVRLEMPKKKTRYFNGFISRFAHTGMHGRLASYRATLVPWLWFLTRTADCRIFQKMKVPDIIEKVFRDHGFTDFERALSGSYPLWDYCVQYRETDFNFVSRLMEQEGIYYFFKHQNGKHTLVLADAKSAHKPAPGYETIRLLRETSGVREGEYIHDWIVEQEVQTGRYALNDFNFEKPKTSLLGKAQVPRTHAMANFEIYDYPGEYDAQSDGEDHYAKIRIQELQAQHETVRGQTNARGLAVGSLFKLADHARKEQNRPYLVTSASYHVTGDDFDSGGGQHGDFYSCSFTAIEADTPFRPARSTPKPLIQGPQTAIVVGPKGEEIYTNKHGQVKLQFHWDRYGKADETSSCWVRVSQEWAGKKWGSIYLPRIGQEVIVEFLEGDPDHPIITGRVYNGDAQPPYDLPAEMTKSTIKSNSSKGGSGFNEMRFEDKKGKEQIFVHAEKDQEIQVKNDRKEQIGRDRHLIVKRHKLERIFGERHERIGKSHFEKIRKDKHLEVMGDDATLILGQQSLIVKGDVVEVFKSCHSEKTTADYCLTADNVIIEAKQNITLKVGGSSIAIEAGGIGIKTSGKIKIESGATMDLKAGAPLTMQSSAKADLKSPTTTIKGDAMVVVQGGLVKIN